MAWLQISFEVERAAAEETAVILEVCGAQSVTLTDAGDDPVLEPMTGETPLWPRTRLTGLFPLDGDVKIAAAEIQDTLPPSRRSLLHVARLEDRVWEREWLKDFRPMRFGRRLWVGPGGQPVLAPDAVTVRLDPGLAFGTGSHATTALCLQWLDAAGLTDRTVVDYGCGSGILAIAAALLGAGRVMAVDHDPQALAATAENAHRNNVTDIVEVFSPGDLPDVQADVVLANILAEPLIELAASLAGRTRPGGTVVLSGILEPQAPAVENAYRPYCRMESRRAHEGWVCLTTRRLGQED